jgi:hypothetical protein
VVFKEKIPASTQSKTRRIPQATGGGTTMHWQIVRNYDRATSSMAASADSVYLSPEGRGRFAQQIV